VTALRARYERALGLSLERQTQECIEYLENPEVLIAEFTDSFLLAEAFDNREEAFLCEELPVRRRTAIGAAVTRMIQSPALRVSGADPYDFSYLSRDIVPLWKQGAEVDIEGAGLDYVGLTTDAPATPILGVVNSPEVPAPFLSLLRLLACLSEVGTESQLERADRFLFKGAVAERVPFDLHMLIVDGAEPVAPVPLVQLTRDLAVVFVTGLCEEWALPPLIRRILCLRLPAADAPFDGTLREDWRA
jgi:hypothetical protein